MFSTVRLCFHRHSRFVRSISRSREVESRGSRSNNRVRGCHLMRRAAFPVVGSSSRLAPSREWVGAGSSPPAGGPPSVLSRAWHRAQPQSTILAYLIAFVKRQEVSFGPPGYLWIVDLRGSDLRPSSADTRGGSQNPNPLPWGEGGERSEPGEGSLDRVGASDPYSPHNRPHTRPASR